MFYPYLPGQRNSKSLQLCIMSIPCCSQGPKHLSDTLSVGLEGIKRYIGRSYTPHLSMHGRYRTKGSQQLAVLTRFYCRAEGATPEADRHGVSNLGIACPSRHVTVWSALKIRNAVCIVFPVKSVIGGNSCTGVFYCMSIDQKKIQAIIGNLHLIDTSSRACLPSSVKQRNFQYFLLVHYSRFHHDIERS